jgi:hypothetical protein
MRLLLGNGVSLRELMQVFGSNSFRSTKQNAENGTGNTDPHRAYMQQADVELTAAAATWLNERLDRAFEEHGTVTPAALDALDWPKFNAKAAAAR